MSPVPSTEPCPHSAPQHDAAKRSTGIASPSPGENASLRLTTCLIAYPSAYGDAAPVYFPSRRHPATSASSVKASTAATGSSGTSVTPLTT